MRRNYNPIFRWYQARKVKRAYTAYYHLPKKKSHKGKIFLAILVLTVLALVIANS